MGSILLGDGVYFTSDPSLAKSYGNDILSRSSENLKIKDLSIEDLKKVGIDINAAEQSPSLLRETFGGEFDGVRVKGFYDRSADIDEVVIFDPKKADEIIKGSDQPAGTRPGMEQRLEEESFNGSRDRQPSEYEPYERAGKSAGFDLTDVARQQDQLRGRVPFDGRSTDPVMTDNTARQLANAVDDDMTFELIEDAYKSVDIKKLRSDLRATDPEVQKLAEETLLMFAGITSMRLICGLHPYCQERGY